MQASGLTKFSPFICTSAEEVKWSESHSVVSDSFHPLDYIVHGILQARILEWAAFPFSRGSFQPRDRTQVSSIAGRFFTTWATKEAHHFSSVAQSCPTLGNPMNCSMPGLPVYHQLPEFTKTHVHWVSDAIQPSHPLSSPSPPAHNPSQHHSLFQWVNS